MKCLIFSLVIMFSCCSVVHTQVESLSLERKSIKKIHYGVAIAQSLTRFSFPTSFLFTANWKKNQIDLGIQHSFISLNYKRNTGAELNYRFYPKTDSMLFCSYPVFNFGYFHQYHEVETIYVNPDEPTLNNKPTVTKYYTHYLCTNIGYGIKFRLSKGLYIGSSVALGATWKLRRRERFFLDGDFIYSGKRNENMLGGLISLQFGYKF